MYSPLPEAVPAHHDAAAEASIVRIKRRKRDAFVRREQVLQDGAALRVQLTCYLRPSIDSTRPATAEDSAAVLLRFDFMAASFANPKVVRHPISEETYPLTGSVITS